MLNEQYVILLIIVDVEKILNHIAWLKNGIPTINIHLCMFVQGIYEYGHLVRIIVLILYLYLGRKYVNLSELYH